MPNTCDCVASWANAGGGARSPWSWVSVELAQTEDTSATLMARTRAT